MSQQVVIARKIATRVHATQVDKLGNAYIDHPRRVAENAVAFAKAANLTDAETVLVEVAAWLHDVIEDSLEATGSQVTADDLITEGISTDAIQLVTLLSKSQDIKVTDPDLERYYAAIAANPLARLVKLADITDNTQPWRVAGLDADARDRLVSKYQHALEELNETRKEMSCCRK